MAKYPDLDLGTIEAIVNKLGGMDGVSRFLRGDLIISECPKKWHEENGVIYFTVTSDGTTGEAWIERLESKGFDVSRYAKGVLRSADFRPTSGVTTEIAVLKGALFANSNRVTKNIRANATERKFTSPNAEIACLIREKFTGAEIKDMGLSAIIVMHEPIDSAGYPFLLHAHRDVGVGWLDAFCGEPDDGWYRDRGFAFAVAQVGT